MDSDIEAWNAKKKSAADTCYFEAISKDSFKAQVVNALNEAGIAIDDVDAQHTI